jgi:hypothetical protein
MANTTKQWEPVIMMTKMTVRYTSGREDQFEVEVFGGQTAEFRLREFAKDPTLVLQTENEVILIPPSAIERITMSLGKSEREQVKLPNVTKAKRLN